VSKSVGKFRTEKDYNDDYNFVVKKKKRHDQAEIRKLKNREFNEYYEDYKDSVPRKVKRF
jgi:hypothetical protein